MMDFERPREHERLRCEVPSFSVNATILQPNDWSDINQTRSLAPQLHGYSSNTADAYLFPLETCPERGLTMIESIDSTLFGDLVLRPSPECIDKDGSSPRLGSQPYVAPSSHGNDLTFSRRAIDILEGSGKLPDTATSTEEVRDMPASSPSFSQDVTSNADLEASWGILSSQDSSDTSNNLWRYQKTEQRPPKWNLVSQSPPEYLISPSRIAPHSNCGEDQWKSSSFEDLGDFLLPVSDDGFDGQRSPSFRKASETESTSTEPLFASPTLRQHSSSSNDAALVALKPSDTPPSTENSVDLVRIPRAARIPCREFLKPLSLKPRLQRRLANKASMNHRCGECSTTFGSNRGLQRHKMSIHGDELNERCQICGRVQRRDNMRRHSKTCERIRRGGLPHGCGRGGKT